MTRKPLPLTDAAKQQEQLTAVLRGREERWRRSGGGARAGGGRGRQLREGEEEAEHANKGRLLSPGMLGGAWQSTFSPKTCRVRGVERRLTRCIRSVKERKETGVRSRDWVCDRG